jgi:hypothetical protein
MAITRKEMDMIQKNTAPVTYSDPLIPDDNR